MICEERKFPSWSLLIDCLEQYRVKSTWQQHCVYCFAYNYSLLNSLISLYTWTYTDETHSDRNLRVDQVKLSEYFFYQNWDQQDTKLTCYSRNTEYAKIVPRSTIN